MVAILVPISFFAMIAAIILAPRYLRSKERQRLQETLQMAIDRGHPLPAEVVEAMVSDVRPAPSARRDLRVGLIWIAIAAGLAALGFFVGFEEPEARYPLFGVAATPAFVGLAFIIMAIVGREKN